MNIDEARNHQNPGREQFGVQIANIAASDPPTRLPFTDLVLGFADYANECVVQIATINERSSDEH